MDWAKDELVQRYIAANSGLRFWIRIRAPDGMPSAIAHAASREGITASEFIRINLTEALAAKGVNIADFVRTHAATSWAESSRASAPRNG